MNATPLHSRRRGAVTARPAAAGFTLIELLTVIAIIAILLAIILPVFATVKENARRTACMSNMQQLYTALRQYELDNRRYPDYLLAPAMVSNGSGGCLVNTTLSPGTSYLTAASSATDPICTVEQAAGTGFLGGQYVDNASGALLPFSGGLYPEYVKSLETYHCPNNTEDLQGADRTNSVAVAAATRAVVGTNATSGTAGSDTPTTQNGVYYRYDSYDANPRIIPATGKLDTANFTTRYSRLWTRVHKGVSGDALPTTGAANFASYRKQLYWRAPSGDTFVTMCTYHAPKGKVTVLWLSGSAKPIDVKKLQNYNGSDATKPNLTATDASRDFDTFKLGPGD